MKLTQSQLRRLIREISEEEMMAMSDEQWREYQRQQMAAAVQAHKPEAERVRQRATAKTRQMQAVKPEPERRVVDRRRADKITDALRQIFTGPDGEVKLTDLLNSDIIDVSDKHALRSLMRESRHVLRKR